MRVLVTGAGGFAGSYLARYLSSRHEVVGNYRRATEAIIDLREERIDLVQCDLHHIAQPFWSRRQFRPFDAVVHTAAAAGPWCGISQIVADNISAMQALVRAAEEWEVKAFIFFSSISTYGRIEESVVEETTPRIDPDPYGMSKTYGERLLRASPVPSLSLRLPGILGPGANVRNWLPGIAKKLEAGETITAYNLDAQYNNAVHVADLAEFVEGALGNDTQFGRWNEVVLGASGQMTVRAAIERLAAELDVPLRLEEARAPRPSFLLSSNRAREHWHYRPMHIAEMISRYASEIA